MEQATVCWYAIGEIELPHNREEPFSLGTGMGGLASPVEIRMQYSDAGLPLDRATLKAGMPSLSPDANPDDVIELARRIIEYYAAAFAFLTGFRTRITRSFAAECRRADGSLRRIQVDAVAEFAVDARPLAADERLLITAVEPEVETMLTWLRYATVHADVVESLLFALSAIDLLSRRFPGGEDVVQSCPHCKKEIRTRPGVRSKYRNLVVDLLGLTDDEFDLLWGVRNDLGHNAPNLTDSFHRERFHRARSVALRVLRRGLKLHLGRSSEEHPSDDLDPIELHEFGREFIDGAPR